MRLNFVIMMQCVYLEEGIYSSYYLHKTCPLKHQILTLYSV
jgi:hypothetical protein